MIEALLISHLFWDNISASNSVLFGIKTWLLFVFLPKFFFLSNNTPLVLLLKYNSNLLALTKNKRIYLFFLIIS